MSLLYAATWNKWWFDELYDYFFVRPTLAYRAHSSLTCSIAASSTASSTRSPISSAASPQVVGVGGDRYIIDNCGQYSSPKKPGTSALSLRSLQTGRLRQYVMFIVVGTIVLFIVASLWWNSPSPDSFAGNRTAN